MSTADLNALLAQVVRAAGESKCNYHEMTGGFEAICREGKVYLDGQVGFPHKACNATGRPPLAQAVREGMTMLCPGYAYNDDAGPGYNAMVIGERAHDDCCNKTLRVPLTIPTSWPDATQQWTVYGICMGVVQVNMPDGGYNHAYWEYLAEHRGLPRGQQALRALEAAIEKEAGK